MSQLITLITANPTATDAEIVALANAPVYRDIASYDARLVIGSASDDLSEWADTLPTATKLAVKQFVLVLRGLLNRIDAADVPMVEQLGVAAVAAEAATQTQIDALLALGKTVGTYTEQDVADTRAEMALEAQRATLRTWFSTSYMNAHALIESSNPLPTKAELVATFNTQE